MITIIKLPKKSGLRTVLFRRALYEQQDKDSKRVHAEAQGIYRHDARERSEMLENCIYPDDPYTADAAHCNERRRKRNAVASHVAAHYIVEERQQMRSRDEHNADITDLHELGIGREDRDQVSSEEQQAGYHDTLYYNTFNKAELKRSLTSVELPRAVVLARKSRACLAEAVKHIVREYLDIKCS